MDNSTLYSDITHTCTSSARHSQGRVCVTRHFIFGANKKPGGANRGLALATLVALPTLDFN